MTIRVLHAAHMRRVSIGVVRQMEYEQQAANELEIAWVSSFYCSDKIDSPVTVQTPSGNGRMRSKHDFYSSLLERAADFDLIFLRYSMYDPQQLWFIRKCPIPVVTMHHTYELTELSSYNNLRSNLLAQAERLIGPYSLRKATAIVGNTMEIANYQRGRSGSSTKPIFQYGNGATYTDDCVIPLSSQTEPYEFLLMAAQFPVWTGVDLLIDAAKKTSAEFKVHLVGKLPQADQDIVKSDERFIQHGPLEWPAIESLMGKCVLGFSVFALHRKGFTKANVLKVREYLRAGLPVYAGHEEIFDEDFPYYRNGPVDFDKIIEYANQVVDVDRSTVSETARPIIDKLVVLANIYKDLQTVATTSD